MSYVPTYDKGQWKADCDDCGYTYKASLLTLRWDNLRVCPKCFETRQPQDFVRAKVDIQAAPWTRPEPSDSFIAVATSSGIAGFAIAGVALSGNILNPGQVPRGTFTNN